MQFIASHLITICLFGFPGSATSIDEILPSYLSNPPLPSGSGHEKERNKNTSSLHLYICIFTHRHIYIYIIYTTMCMQCRASLVRLPGISIHHLLMIVLCSLRRNLEREGGLDSPLLSSRCKQHSRWMRRCIEWPSCSWWWSFLLRVSWSEWVGISGGHSPHLQKLLRASGRFHITQLVVQLLLLLLHKKRTNQHVPVSLPNM